MSFPSSSQSRSQNQTSDSDLPLWVQIAQVQILQTQYVSPVYIMSESDPSSSQPAPTPPNRSCIPNTSTSTSISKQITRSNYIYSYESTTAQTVPSTLPSEATTATTYVSHLKPRGSVGWAGQLNTKKIEMEQKSKTGSLAVGSPEVATTELVIRERGKGGASIGSGDRDRGVIKKS